MTAEQTIEEALETLMLNSAPWDTQDRHWLDALGALEAGGGAQ